MEKPQKAFSEAIYGYVAMIPKGRVMTYGQLAALVGHPRAARLVGGVAHYGPENLPWHRVVNKQGGLASGYTWGGREGHAQRLREEGVEVSEDYTINIDSLLWYPQQ
jgi:methylated-DNA-protein-cysteine methyltransferase related protein